jgi:hypothetical protein
MIAYRHAVRAAAQRIANAIDHSVAALRAGRVEQEPAMTDRMLGAIEEGLIDCHVKGIRWTAKTLTDRGPGSQESEYGADFMGVLNIELPEFTVSKGFLAQAKLIRGGSSGDMRKLKKQCDKMLNLSPDSFVFLYGPYGVRVVPALSVIGTSVDPVHLYSRFAQRFFEEHLECFIGDRAIQSPTFANLKAMRDRFDARSAMLIEAEEDNN